MTDDPSQTRALAERAQPGESLAAGVVARRWLTGVGRSFIRPRDVVRESQRDEIGSDIRAGLTVAVVLVPQAMAYALVADLPPQIGLYAAMVAVVVGALWGSSHHLNTGPTNATSLLVAATLAPIVVVGTQSYVAAAGVLAILAGLLRLFFGVAKLGVLVNFVSSSVVVGFTAGAGVLIAVNQLRHLLRVDIESTRSFVQAFLRTVGAAGAAHWPSLALGLGTIVVMVVVRRLRPLWPSALIALLLAGLAVYLFDLADGGVAVMGGLSGGLPPLTRFDLFDFSLLGDMMVGALAIAAIGLVEAMSIARSVAAASGQRLDSNQEFLGQGLANVATGILSGYPVSGSFTRTTINYNAGARSSLSGAFAGGFVLLAALALAPLASYLPRTALAGVILVTAWTMVDRREMKNILRASFGDSAIMLSTLAATLLLPLQVAVLLGIGVSFVRYIIKTSHPEVLTVAPDPGFRHLVHDAGALTCPQLGIIAIRGSLYFGAVDYIEEVIHDNIARHPDQQFLLLRMHAVDHCDVAGVRMLESVVRLYRERGGDVYLVRVRAPVEHTMELLGFDELLGEDHFLDQDDAIGHLFHDVLDPTTCVYDCPFRVFAECQAVPKYDKSADGLPPDDIASDEPMVAWTAAELARRIEIAGEGAPLHLVDVREDFEFAQGHIPGARLIPLSRFVDEIGLCGFAETDTIVLLCRTGRRSARAGYLLKSFDFVDVIQLEGGFLAWKAGGYPVAIPGSDELVEDPLGAPVTPQVDPA